MNLPFLAGYTHLHIEAQDPKNQTTPQITKNCATILAVFKPQPFIVKTPPRFLQLTLTFSSVSFWHKPKSAFHHVFVHGNLKIPIKSSSKIGKSHGKSGKSHGKSWMLELSGFAFRSTSPGRCGSRSPRPAGDPHTFDAGCESGPSPQPRGDQHRTWSFQRDDHGNVITISISSNIYENN